MIKLDNGERVSGHKPSVDAMMYSIASLNDSNVIGVIMTGMGADGADGMSKVKANKVLSECKTIQELYDMVEFIYKCYYNDEYKEPLNLTYRLVKLLEKPNEIKDFPFKD